MDKATARRGAAAIARRLELPVLFTLPVIGAFGLLTVAGVHLADVADKLEETPYLGILFILGPISVSLLAALLLLTGREQLGWLIGGAIAAGTIVGYVLSRTTGLPKSSEDVGNWGEPIGVMSLIVEGIVVLCAILVAIRARTQHEATAAVPSARLPESEATRAQL